MCLTHCVVRSRFDASPKREVISRSVQLLREVLHAVNIMITKSFRLLSGMLSVKFLVFMSAPIFVRKREYMVLK